MTQSAAPPTFPGALLPPAGDRAHPRTPAPAHVAPPAPGGARTRSVAARIHAYGGAEVLQVDEVPVPVPGAGQLLVAVGAAGVNGLDWKMREGYVRDVYPLTFPTALGLELAGEVAAVGAGVTRFRAGDRVMGLTRGPGAYADFVVVDEAQVARTPAALSDVEAAALPVAVLTAAQALHAGGEIRAGSTILIHGAAGAVGGFAVQLARAAGATVLATASGTSRDHVLGLGAALVIDYRAERFEERAADVDLVLDLVGGETLDRSWSVLAPHGVVVSTAAPDVAARAPDGRRGVWCMMRADAEQLARLADDVARGALRSTVAEVTPLSGLAAAIERNRTGHPPGKIVLDLRDTPDDPPAAYPPVPPDDLRRQLAVARPDTDQSLPHLGIGSGTYTILLGGRETAGRYAVIDMHVPPGGGPPPHRHDFEEMFTVLDGEIEVTFRGETVRLRAGETANVPANAPHAFRVVSEAPARLLCMCTPAGQEEFFREVGVPLPTRTTAPPPPDPDVRARTIARTLALAPKYRSELTGS